MQGDVRKWHASGGAVLALASAVAVAPLVARSAELPTVSIPMRLVDATSDLLNVPVNLFYDIMNIPETEVQAINSLAESLFFAGPWAVGSATNIWGEDPGDPGKFEGLVNMLVPFSALSGMNSPEFDWSAGLGQQLVGFLNAEIPVSASCDAEICSPIVPTSPITGFTGLDSNLWWAEILTGQEKFPLMNQWFQVPFNQLLTGYTFDQNYPGYVDPSGSANSLWNLLGTNSVDGQNLMPWDGSTYTLDLSGPFTNFFNSLTATPATDGLLGTGIEFPTGTEFGQALQALLAGAVVAFDPLTAISPDCTGSCSAFSYPELVQDIANSSPGNTSPIIEDWLTAYQTALTDPGSVGAANLPTAEQLALEVAALSPGYWDFGNPSPDPSLSVGGFDPSTLAPEFQQLWTDLGIYNPGGASSGFDLSALSADLTSLLGLGAATDLSSQLSAELSTLLGDLGTTLPANLSALPLELLSSI